MVKYRRFVRSKVSVLCINSKPLLKLESCKGKCVRCTSNATAINVLKLLIRS